MSNKSKQSMPTGEKASARYAKHLPIVRLAALTAAALAVHGYHLGVDDGEIYVPAARRLLNPKLYPFAPEFFLSHAHLSLFSPILAWTARLTHLSMDATIFSWYVLTLFAMMIASWKLACACFNSSRARWSAVLILAAVVSMPATNTGLLLIDPYLSARSFSTPLTLFVLAAVLEKNYLAAGICVLITGTIHPQMVTYLVFLIGVMWTVEQTRRKETPRTATFASFVWILPGGFNLAPAVEPYREALYSRDFYFIANWQWYHWLGMLAPLAFLAWFWRGKLNGTRPGFSRLSFALIPFGLLSIVVSLIFATSHEFDYFARTQPLRTFHLITIIFVLFLGGIVGEYAGTKLRWLPSTLALLLACGMFYVQLESYPRSPHVEWPSATSRNPWVNTLLWIRANTPEDAVFAVDSRYFLENDADQHGFRALSARSALADYYKDGGVVAIFPFLAPEWKQMSNATYGLNHFSRVQFEYLRKEYPEVSWTVIHGAAPSGFDCPYQRDSFEVCRIPLPNSN
jgi:hypothetical protein